MRNQRDNLGYIGHIRDAILKIKRYVLNHTYEEYAENEGDRDAVMRNLEVIGEAAGNIDELFKSKHAEIDWRKVKDLRNVLIHDYADVDIKLVWRIITKNIPELDKQISTLLEKNDLPN